MRVESDSSLFFQYLATVTGCLCIICTGMVFGWPSPSLPILLSKDSPLPLTSSEGSWMAVIPSIGAVAGAVIAAFLVDRIGRKTCMLITSPLYMTSWIMTAFSTSLPVLTVSRFLPGISDGIAFTVFPMYLGEIAHPRIRGFLGSSIQISVTLGLILINVIGAYLSIKSTALVTAAIPFLHFITFYFMPESPYYLIMKDKMKTATKTLQKLYGKNDVQSELHRLSVAVKTDMQDAGKIWDLFTIPSNRKAIFIILGLRIFQQLSGTSAVTFYTTMIFSNSYPEISPNLAAVLYFIVQLGVSVVFSALVDKFGRRPLLLVSTAGTAVTLALMGLYFYFHKFTDVDTSAVQILPLVVLICYVIIFSVGLGTIPVLMLGELFPTSVKAFALCLADVSFGITVAVVAKLFQIMDDSFGIHVPFLVFAVCSVLCFFFIFFIVPETKGKTLEQIQVELRGKSTF